MKAYILYSIYWIIKPIEFSVYEKIRRWILKTLSINIGTNLRVKPNVSIHNMELLKLGSEVTINPFCFLSCYGGLTIGDYVSIGHNTTIITTDHGFSDPDMPIKFQPLVCKPVIIGSNVWIGANVTILGGVELAEGTIVAAGAVVKNSVTDKNTIIGGVPSKHIKYYKN